VSLAEAYLASKETNAAVVEYELAVKCNDRNGLAHYNLGVLLDSRAKCGSAAAFPDGYGGGSKERRCSQ